MTREVCAHFYLLFSCSALAFSICRSLENMKCYFVLSANAQQMFSTSSTFFCLLQILFMATIKVVTASIQLCLWFSNHNKQCTVLAKTIAGGKEWAQQWHESALFMDSNEFHICYQWLLSILMEFSNEKFEKKLVYCFNLNLKI